MKYKIRYCYNTGDSFHTESNLESLLELEWTNLKVAQENLQRIKEHYEWYQLLNTDWARGTVEHDKKCKEATKLALTKDWSAKKKTKKGLEIEYQIYIILKTDDGKDWQISAPWCGYFESLNWAEIEQPEDTLNKITF